MDDSTIDYILNDKEIDPVSGVPFAVVVYMLYYGLELKHFLTEISDELVDTYDLVKHEVGEYSIYRSGSVAQGFYLNTNYLPDARDIDVVAISHRYDIRERCKYNEDVESGVDVAIWDIGNTNHDNVDKISQDSCITITQCEENDDVYFNVKVLEDTPPGYALIERCRRRRKVGETQKERFVSSLKATEARVKFWSDLQPLIKQKFQGTQTDAQEKESSLFSFIEPHGPAATAFMSLFEATTPFETDFVYCVPYPRPWPAIAESFLTRERPSGWPSETLISQIFDDGCTLIPKGEIGSKMEDYEWRISFTGELRLARALNRTQRELIHAFKALISEPQHPYDVLDISTSVESYHLLTLMYHETEVADPSMWTPQNIAKMMFMLLDKYVQHFEMRYLPHFMISSRNVFAKYRDLSDAEVDTVLYTILRIRRDPVGQIIQQEKYLNLPVHIHKWAFQPIEDGIRLNPKQQLHPMTYVQSLLRLSKGHFGERHFDKAVQYANDAKRFFLKIDDKGTTVHDSIDLHLTLAMSQHRNGETKNAIYSLDTIRHAVQHEEDNLDSLTLGLFYQFSARLKFTACSIGIFGQNDDFQSDFSKSMRFLAISQDVVVERMYFTMITNGPVRIKEFANEIHGSLPEMVDDIVNAEDIKIIYDRKQQITPHDVIRNDEILTSQIHEEINDLPTTDDLLSTAFGVKTNEEYDVFMKGHSLTQKDHRYTDENSDNPDVSQPGTESSENEIRTRPQLDTTIITDSDQIANVGKADLDEADANVGSTETNDLPEEIVYDRKRFVPMEESNQFHDRSQSDESAQDTSTKFNDDKFTDAEVNMVDARHVQELCRSKLFKMLGMHDKASDILVRLKYNIEIAKRSGRKISIRMVERALEMYMENAKSLSKAEEDVGIIDNNHIYFSETEKPYLDTILQEAFEKMDTKMLVLPVPTLLYHTKMLYFTKTDMFEEAEAVFRSLETFIDDLEDSKDTRVSEVVLGLHKEALSKHFIVDIQLSEDFQAESESFTEELTVKQQVFKWLEAVFDTMRKYEPKNKYLDEVFSNG